MAGLLAEGVPQLALAAPPCPADAISGTHPLSPTHPLPPAATAAHPHPSLLLSTCPATGTSGTHLTTIGTGGSSFPPVSVAAPTSETDPACYLFIVYNILVLAA